MRYEIIPVLCNEKNMANYAYIVHNREDGMSIVIDAAEANPTIAALEKLQLIPSYILTTHHHFDHVEGNLILKEKYKTRIVAPEKEFSKVPGADIPVSENTPLSLGNMKFTVLDAPGHTLGHVLYYLPDGKMLFTGDVLFNLCIGGLFEGTPKQRGTTLQKIKSLPDDTEIYPGHEYTRACIPPHIKEAPDFTAYLQKMLQRENGKKAPATLGEEKKFNPYLLSSNLTEFMETK